MYNYWRNRVFMGRHKKKAWVPDTASRNIFNLLTEKREAAVILL
jgi:hypothetical protein